MAIDKTNNLTIFLQEIADALRYAKKLEGPINPQDFAQLIREINVSDVGNILEDNTITLLSNLLINDTYDLYYEDADENLLENFGKICQLVVSDANVSYYDLNEFNIAPYLSEKIGVYKSNGDRAGYISITNLKPEYGERLYRFGLISDVHQQSSQTTENTEDLIRALSLFNNKESVEFTCICGDISQNGTASEFSLFQTNVSNNSPNTPVYTTTGNHDCTSSGLDVDSWVTYTGHEEVFEITKTLDDGSIDHFLFFGMHTWSLGSNGTPYAQSSIDWLKEKVETYKFERTFIFTHLFFPDRAGNVNEVYSSSLWLGGTQLTELESIIKKYPNTYWFSGHSHWKWSMQSFESDANIFVEKNRLYPESGWAIHIPSCAEPRTLNSEGTTRIDCPLESEGSVIDVYKDYIDIRGIDLKNNLYLPISTFRVNTPIEPLCPPATIITDNNWELGRWGTSDGVEDDWTSDLNPIRTIELTPVSKNYRYYITTIAPIGGPRSDDLGIRELSIGLYDVNQNYLGRADGFTLTTKPGSTLEDVAYFDDVYDRVEITDNIFNTYSTEVAYIRLKCYGCNSIFQLTPEHGHKFVILQQFNESYNPDTEPEIPYLKASDFEIMTGSPEVIDLDNDYVQITFTAKDQKFYVGGYGYDSSIQQIAHYICEDATAIAKNGIDYTDSASTIKFGWWSNDTAYAGITGSVDLDASGTEKPQFNMSSSASLPVSSSKFFPLTITLKARMYFTTRE